jgi:hypothetical protein
MVQQQAPAGALPAFPLPAVPLVFWRAELWSRFQIRGASPLGVSLGWLREACCGDGPAGSGGSAAAASTACGGWSGGREIRPQAATEAAPIGLPAVAALLGFLLVAWLLLAPGWAAPAWATELQVSAVSLEPCPLEDAGSQPELRRPSGASCYALRGEVNNPGRQPVVDTDVFALILDSSGEPVLPNRSRVGSIGDVPPGVSRFALRLAIPAGTPGPFRVRNPRARGFSAPVRSRAGEGQELLPLEEAVAAS